MGIFSCFSSPKITDGSDSARAYKIDGLDTKEGVTPSGSPGKGRRAAGTESLSGSPRKRLDYDSLVKSKQMPGHGVGNGGCGAGNVELANARALVRALARKPESRYSITSASECICLICSPAIMRTEVRAIRVLHLTDVTQPCRLAVMHLLVCVTAVRVPWHHSTLCKVCLTCYSVLSLGISLPG